MTTGQELGQLISKLVSNVAKLWNAIMKQRLRLFAIYQTTTSLQRTYNLNPRTIWYPALDESNHMKSAYLTIHPGKILLLKMVAFWNPFFFRKHRFHILHFSNSTRLFTKPTGRHYTKHRFSWTLGYAYVFSPCFQPRARAGVKKILPCEVCHGLLVPICDTYQDQSQVRTLRILAKLLPD